MDIGLQAIVAPPRLQAAWHKVRANGGQAGGDGVSLDAFEAHVDAHLEALAREVCSDRYRPRPYRYVCLTEDGGRPRELAVPSVRDRVLQTATCAVLEPVLEREFEDCSYGYRKGRSVQSAAARIREHWRAGYRWVVDADIAAFFDSIDHARLLATLQAVITAAEVVKIVRDWLRAQVRDGERRWCIARGVPQGAPISPLLANLYLDAFDEAVMGPERKLVRYADDFLVLCRSRDAAEKALELTEDVLETLQLDLNRHKTRITNFNRGFRFLGLEFLQTLRVREAPPRKRRKAIHRTPTRTPASAAAATSPRVLPRAAIRPMPASAAQPADDAAGADGSTRSTPVVEAPGGHPRPSNPQSRAIADVLFEPALRTLYVSTQGATLAADGERLAVRQHRVTLASAPVAQVDLVVVLGIVGITTPAMRLCLLHGIPIALLSQGGLFRGRIDAFGTDDVTLHRAQFERAADPAATLALARAFVIGKLHNCRVVLQRYARVREAPHLLDAAQSIGRLRLRAGRAESLDELRGTEGAGARAYFDALASVFAPEWGFAGRARQPPPDPVNALLSFGYALLAVNVLAFLRARGLNPHLGFLHAPRRGHPALASDLIEELRAPIVDSLVLSLLLRRRLSPADFVSAAGGGCRLSDEGRRRYVAAFETKLAATTTHPRIGRALDYRRCIDAQVRHLADVLRGAAPAYLPLLLR